MPALQAHNLTCFSHGHHPYDQEPQDTYKTVQVFIMPIFMIALAGIAAIAGSAMVAAAMAESIDAPFLQVGARREQHWCMNNFSRII